MIGSEVLIVSGIVGGVSGILFRDKSKSKWIGFVLGFIGGIITTLILLYFIFKTYIAILLYSILGSWYFNFIVKKISK